MSHGVEPGVKTRGSVDVERDEQVARSRRQKENLHHKLRHFLRMRVVT